MTPKNIPIANAEASIAARSAALEKSPRLKNWRSTRPVSYPTKPGDYASETIHYKGSFRGWHGHEYYPEYQSVLLIRNKFQADYTLAGSTRHLRAPAGTEWDYDGSLVVSNDYDLEYHPTSEDLLARDFARRVRMQLRDAKIKRAAAQAKARLLREQALVIDREIHSTRVLLEDARRAGNCVEGTCRYAESRLGIDRETLLRGSWLVSVSATRLLDDPSERVQRAIQAAWARETAISI